MKKWILGGIGLCMFLPILAQQIQKEGYLVMDMVHQPWGCHDTECFPQAGEVSLFWYEWHGHQ